MKAIHAINLNGITPYLQSKVVYTTEMLTIMNMVTGLNSYSLEFKKSENNNTRVYCLSRMYLEVSKFCKFFHLKFTINKRTNYIPNLWYDIDSIEDSLFNINFILYNWTMGKELYILTLQNIINKLLATMCDLCLVLNVRPEDVLSYALEGEAAILTLADIKRIRLIKPVYRKRGRPSRWEMNSKTAKVAIEDLEVLKIQPKDLNQSLTVKTLPIEERTYKIHKEIFRRIYEEKIST